MGSRRKCSRASLEMRWFNHSSLPLSSLMDALEMGMIRLCCFGVLYIPFKGQLQMSQTEWRANVKSSLCFREFKRPWWGHVNNSLNTKDFTNTSLNSPCDFFWGKKHILLQHLPKPSLIIIKVIYCSSGGLGKLTDNMIQI